MIFKLMNTYYSHVLYAVFVFQQFWFSCAKILLFFPGDYFPSVFFFCYQFADYFFSAISHGTIFYLTQVIVFFILNAMPHNFAITLCFLFTFTCF